MNIEEALKNHHVWLETSGKDGKRFSAIGTDLSEANLSEANLSEANLSRANLSRANLSRANLSRADLSNADLSRADLSNTNLSNADLWSTNLSNADLSRANLSNADLSNAILCGTNFSNANLNNADLSNANPSDNDIWSAILSDAGFSDDDLWSTNLRDANLKDANLRDADLSDADLINANLSNADLSNAFLKRANLIAANLNAANLNAANLNAANLNAANLNAANLKRANLIAAQLVRANLNEANLNEANLNEADLSGANLYRVQALQTNFNSAVLTGACIEDWNINSKTELESIVCQAIYLKMTYAGTYTDRRPSNQDATFADCDFARLVRKAQDTVDLIFHNGIDWKALAISTERFKVESNGAELTIQAIENKGEGDFVIRVNVPVDANKSELEKFLKQEYEFARNALEAQYRYQLEAKDRQIEIYHQQSTNLTEIMKLMASRQINVVNTAISESNSVSDNISINQSGAINPNASVAKDNARVQNILHNYPAEQQKSLAEAAAEIQQLLEQLSATYPTTTIAEKSAVATKAIETIEKNPAQKAKIVKALKAGGIGLLKELVEPVMKPVTNILFPMLEELIKD